MLVAELMFKIFADRRIGRRIGPLPTWQFYVLATSRMVRLMLHQHSFGGMYGRPGADALGRELPYIRDVSIGGRTRADPRHARELILIWAVRARRGAAQR